LRIENQVSKKTGVRQVARERHDAFFQNVGLHIPEDYNIHNYSCDNLKSHIAVLISEKFRENISHSEQTFGYASA
jgi:hypothetical protein